MESNPTTVFSRFFFIVPIEDFYQFASVLKKAICDHSTGEEKVH